MRTAIDFSGGSEMADSATRPIEPLFATKVRDCNVFH